MELADRQRAAIVDLGSNSVRMVVFEGTRRNPVVSFNEKHTLRLGKGLDKTGKLNEEGVTKAMDVLARFATVASAMGADPFHILATAAVRDASNGKEFIKAAQKLLPQATFRILNGEEEADYAATGVLCALPEADGIVADIGGGSLELIHIAGRQRHEATTTPLGVIRLRERADGNLQEAARIVSAQLQSVSWLSARQGKTLYLVGGAFRALARLYIARQDYPLNIVNLLRLSVQQGRELSCWLIETSETELKAVGNVGAKRLPDVPYAATVLLELIDYLSPSRIIFSTEGLREGWYMRHVAASLWDFDPRLILLEEMAARFSRQVMSPNLLYDWTSFLFRGEEGVGETGLQATWRYYACLISDIGAYAHPEYRVDEASRLVLYNQGVGFDHETRAFLALVLGVRYGMDRDDPLLDIAGIILTEESFRRAILLGALIRLAYTLCAGTDILLKSCQLSVREGVLTLDLGAGLLRSAGSAVETRLKRLAKELGMPFIILEQ
ncbi:Ppx/GppA family phosphatase [Acetobacteraceae bacterium ESL0709]|nr:Ppx/GppA family phosphatase [Acetobacteraceae bacterium ESL0697]MDF7677847.1 Ppx/GppA family phosphatase [Acetobacteraceae bacterium ESL0709]